MSIVGLILAELYILAGGELLPLGNLLKVLGLIFLSTMASGSLVFSWHPFKTQNAYGVASTVVNTLIGFLMGIYVPIGVLPSAVQTAIRLFPISHAAVLFRRY